MRYFAKNAICFVLAVMCCGTVGCTSVNAKAEAKKNVEWKALFNGNNLDGWEVRSGFAKYHIENGQIVGTTATGSPNTFLCTKKQYGDFILEFEVKVDPVLNSGVQIRSNVYKTDTTVWTQPTKGQKKKRVHKAGRVYGYQVEISNAEKGTSGGIYDEARRGWLDNISGKEGANKAFKDNQWNKYRVVCIGDSIKTWINGVACADLADSMTQTGLIGLQVHGFKGDKPSQVRWRNIRIKDLGKHTWKALFDGRSFAGWHKLPGGKWEIRDGAIIGSNESSDGRHGLLVSDEIYDNFTARLKFKAVQGNSGFYFRAEKVAGSVGVHGFQAEIDAAKDVGGLYETGGRGWVVQPGSEDVQKWFKPGQWNEMTVSAHGGRIVVHVNGIKSAELKNDKGRAKGHFAIQLHGGQDMEVMIKDVEILVPNKPRASKFGQDRQRRNTSLDLRRVLHRL